MNIELEFKEGIIPFNQRQSQTTGLEIMLTEDAKDIYPLACLICGSELETIGEVRNKACRTCNERK